MHGLGRGCPEAASAAGGRMSDDAAVAAAARATGPARAAGAARAPRVGRAAVGHAAAAGIGNAEKRIETIFERKRHREAEAPRHGVRRIEKLIAVGVDARAARLRPGLAGRLSFV